MMKHGAPRTKWLLRFLVISACISSTRARVYWVKRCNTRGVTRTGTRRLLARFLARFRSRSRSESLARLRPTFYALLKNKIADQPPPPTLLTPCGVKLALQALIFQTNDRGVVIFSGFSRAFFSCRALKSPGEGISQEEMTIAARV